ncbi:hypothetical protein D9757_010325 [Collybiopsis confluens]|uniref:DUF6534 domain-containing protein n=1 Tax=Collybiopsis confluens TaxID=2823264 RepID=A0A8H5GMR1_9AGAR|nr:hypothetical protein D9757_010325 [Collybiopsis confluens]
MRNGPAGIAHGPLLIGFIFNVALFGLLTGQVFHYHTAYKDRIWIRCLVNMIYLMNIVSTAFIAEYLYDSLIFHFGDVVSLTRANWVFATGYHICTAPVREYHGQPSTQSPSQFCVQIFFTWRIKEVTKNNWMALFVFLSALISIMGSLATAVQVAQHPVFEEFVSFKEWALLWLLGSSTCDIVITVILVLYLVRNLNRTRYFFDSTCQRKQKTGFKSSDKLVDRIIRMTVRTGLLTTVCAIVDAMVYLLDPTGTHLIFNLPLAKLYSVTFMSSLNSREDWALGKSRNLRSTVSTIGSERVSSNIRSFCKKISNSSSSSLGTVVVPEVHIRVERHEMKHVSRVPNSEAAFRNCVDRRDGVKIEGKHVPLEAANIV